MSQPNRSASYYINLVLQSQGDADSTVRSLQQANNYGGNMNVTFNQTQQVAKTASKQFRRLALDLRMVSMGIRTLQREIGGVNPAFSTMASVVQVSTAVIMVAEGASRLLARAEAEKAAFIKAATAATIEQTLAEEINSAVANELMAATVGLGISEAATTGFMQENTIAVTANGAAMLGARAAVEGLKIAFSTFWPILVILATIGTIAWLNDMTSGASGARREITQLTDANDELRVSMSALRAEQSGLTAEQTEYQALITSLESQIVKFGERDDLVRQLNAAKAASRELNVELSQGRVALAAEEAQVASNTAGMQAYELIKKRAAFGYQVSRDVDKTGIFQGIESNVIRNPHISVPGAQAGAELTKTGMIYAHAGEVVAPREQIPSLAGGGGGGLSLTISMAGANIYGADGVRQALMDGANAAMSTINNKRNRLNFLKTSGG